jgi:hypothetical protein
LVVGRLLVAERNRVCIHHQIKKRGGGDTWGCPWGGAESDSVFRFVFVRYVWFACDFLIFTVPATLPVPHRLHTDTRRFGFSGPLGARRLPSVRLIDGDVRVEPVVQGC